MIGVARIDEWDAVFVYSGYALRNRWVCGSECYAPMQYNKRAKQTHPYLIYTIFTHWGKFLASLHFIEHIPGCIDLYLANQGGMGDDLSHDPYVSGNFAVSAPPNVSNAKSEDLGWLGCP
jgi:hypothetical protein